MRSKRSAVAGFMVVSWLFLALSAKGAEAPTISAWSNSKTGDGQIYLKVTPGETITFTVTAQGADRYRWEIGSSVQNQVQGDSFTWVVPGKGLWKIRAKSSSPAYRQYVEELVGRCADYWNKNPQDQWADWMRDALTTSDARREWIVSTAFANVAPGESIPAAIASLDAEGGIVNLLPGTHTVVDPITIARSNLAVVGTHLAIVEHATTKTARYAADPCFTVPRGGEYHDITFKGFDTTSTYTFSYCRIFRAEQITNFTVEDIHDTSWAKSLASVPSDQSNPAYSKNIFFRDNTTTHRAGLSVMFAENIHWINNTVRRGHIDLNRNLTHVFVYGNYVENAANYNIRGHGARYAHIWGNTLVGGQAGVYNDGLRDSIVENNTIRGATLQGGIFIKPQAWLPGTTYRNNRIADCTNGVYTEHYSHGFSGYVTGVVIANNTIYNSSGDGIHMTSEYVKLDVRNNIIAGSGRYGIEYVTTKQPTTITYNDFWNNTQGNYHNTSAGMGDISSDPLLADPAGGDFHLKSKAGRWDPQAKAWTADDVHSPCIDAGDPNDDFSNEPSPNGRRLNIGAYGNTAEASKSLPPPLVAVTGRHVFYNQSAFDGNDPAANAADDGAIATDKSALLPGQTATFANYTSYVRGINGVMVDIDNLPGTPGLFDFTFKVGNDNNPGAWAVAPAPSSITVRPAAGVGGAGRVTITWPIGAIRNQWLQVTVKATAVTGLSQPDVFYFGNATGDSGNSATDAKVDTTDEMRARMDPHKHQLNPAGIENPHDYTRDGVVDTTDEVIARAFNTTLLDGLNLITAP